MVGEAASRAQALEIIGGGTRRAGPPDDGGAVQLRTAGLNGITLYEPASLTLAAKAGTPLAEVEAALLAEGQHLPFEPADWRALLGTTGEPTIGGMVSVAAAGPRRIQAGSVRDSAIGVRFVDGSGTIIKNGGRVMKNVTGYDLVKLMCGAQGTLGVLTEITFKLLPKPQASATLSLEGLSPKAAVDALSAGLGSPFDVNGAAHAGSGKAARTLLRVEGFAGSVRYRAEKLQELLSAHGAVAISHDASANAAIWKSVRDVEPFAGKPGAVWRIALRPSSAPAFVEAVTGQAVCDSLLDWGGGLVWLMVDGAPHCAAGLVRAALAPLGGSATLVRAPVGESAIAGAFASQSAAIDALSTGLRRQFDPKGIFNRGRMRFNAAA